jgi:hypothetical protein
MDLFYDIWQDFNIREARRAAASARHDLQHEIDDLSARCNQALLVCNALWTLLRDKLGMTEQDLLNRVKELDLTDGKLDGRVTAKSIECPACKHVVTRRFPRCVYCGGPIKADLFTP